MWTGRQTLASIEQAIGRLRGEEGQLDSALRNAVGELERLRTEQSGALRELARVKLDEMAAGRLATRLDAGERRALQILDDYRLRIASTAERSSRLQEEVRAADSERHAAAAAVEGALEIVEKLRAAAEGKARSGGDWQAAKAALGKADAIAGEAESKAASSEAELGAKRKPYDEDPLFTYLWQRKFGRSEYRAGNLARAIDRMVAELVDFASVRPNYAALIEIPLRLREHATAKRAEADALRTPLAAIERRAMVEAGVEAKEAVLAEARHKLAAADDMAQKKQELLRQVDEERAVLVAKGTSLAYGDALGTIAAADSKDDVATLYLEAQRTPTPADDAIVRRIDGLNGSIGKLDAEIEGLRRTAQELARRRLEMEQVRSRFRTTGYDHPSITFGNEGDIGSVLERMLAGAVSSGALWDLLRRSYQYREPMGRPDFGAPHFPLPFPLPGGGSIGSSGGTWREPSSRGGWAPTFDPPASGGGGSDDDDRFTTGGTF